MKWKIFICGNKMDGTPSECHKNIYIIKIRKRKKKKTLCTEMVVILYKCFTVWIKNIFHVVRSDWSICFCPLLAFLMLICPIVNSTLCIELSSVFYFHTSASDKNESVFNFLSPQLRAQMMTVIVCRKTLSK